MSCSTTDNREGIARVKRRHSIALRQSDAGLRSPRSSKRGNTLARRVLLVLRRLLRRNAMVSSPPPLRERDIEHYLAKRVKAMGGEVRKVKWIGRRGAPDRLVMLPVHQALGAWSWPGATIWVELKAPGKKTEPHQAREHARMRAMGQCVAVVDSLAGVDALFV